MGRRRRGGAALARSFVAGLVLSAATGSSLAQTPPGDVRGSVLQGEADAAKQLIILGVQQAISSLPPTSAQSFTYTFDPETDVFVRSDRLGPTVLRSPKTIGQGRWSLRLATSYFELSESFGPIDYSIESGGRPPEFSKFGLSPQAEVGVIDLAVTYGVVSWLEINLSVPITIVQAQAVASVTTARACLTDDIGAACLPVVRDRGRLGSPEFRRGTDPDLIQVAAPMREFSVDFNDGTSVGLGRIGIGVKGEVYADPTFQLSVAPEISLPSPSESEFAGSDSTGLAARVIGGAKLAEIVRLYGDVGYQYDTSFEELSRLVWDVGISMPLAIATFDFGVGGSLYDKAIDWTPSTVQISDPATQRDITLTALGDNSLGRNFIDLLGGVKLNLRDGAVLSGAVTVPVTSDGFRPAAVGTLVLEVYF